MLFKAMWEMNFKIKYMERRILREKSGVRRYESFDSAKKAIRKRINKIDISQYTNNMRQGINSAYRNRVADLIEALLHADAFFTSDDDIPTDSEYNNIDQYDEPADSFSDFSLECDGSEYLMFEYKEGASPLIKTDMLTPENEEYTYEFLYKARKNSKDDKNSVKYMEIGLNPVYSLEKSAYPILILRAIQSSDKPITQEEIIKTIRKENKLSTEDGRELCVNMDRKTIQRNIDLLRKCGYNVEHSPRKGYYIPRERSVSIDCSEEDISSNK